MFVIFGSRGLQKKVGGEKGKEVLRREERREVGEKERDR